MKRRQRHTLAALLSIPLCAGCTALPASAWKQLDEAKDEYITRDYESATRKLDAFLNRYPHHPDSAQAYYLRALCHVQQSNKARANIDAQHCIRLSRHEDLTTSAHVTAASLLFESGRYAAATQHYAEALRHLPEKPPTDLVRFRYGLCLQRTGKWKEARLQFAVVYQHYPTSVLASPAKNLYHWPVDHFAIQCGAFRNEAAAKTLRKRLGRSGVHARVEPRSRSGELLYLVFAGRFPVYEQAQEALPRIRGQVADALIVP